MYKTYTAPRNKSIGRIYSILYIGTQIARTKQYNIQNRMKPNSTVSRVYITLTHLRYMLYYYIRMRLFYLPAVCII